MWFQTCWLQCSTPSIRPWERLTGDLMDCDWPTKLQTQLFVTFMSMFVFQCDMKLTLSTRCIMCATRVCTLAFLLFFIKLWILSYLVINQPLRAELEVLLPPVRLGQLWHSLWRWTAAHQKDLLGSFWLYISKGEVLLLHYVMTSSLWHAWYLRPVNDSWLWKQSSSPELIEFGKK